MVILVEAILIDAHEGEELWVDHLLSLQDAHFVREDLPKVCLHLFGLLIQRKEHLWLEVEQQAAVLGVSLLWLLGLWKDILLESMLRQTTDKEILNEPVRVFLDT